VEAGPVRYAVTDDGVSIAFRRFGTGPPLVMPPTAVIDTVSQSVELGFVPVSSAHSVVRYDRRGTGLSDRDAVGFTAEQAAADLDAVIAAVTDDAVPLVGAGLCGPLVLRYAAINASKVSHLVLPFTFPSLQAMLDTPAVRAQRAALEQDFEFWSYATAGWGTRGSRETASLVDIIRDDMDHEGVLATFSDMADHDASDVIGDISAPALVVLRSGWRQHFPDQRRLPAELADAQVLTDDSTDPLSLLPDTVRAVTQFLGVTDPGHAGSPSQTIMFTDLVSSTSMTQQLGDQAAQDVLERHDRAVRAALDAHRGREIKHTGDGIMAVFVSALDAALAATRIQDQLIQDRVSARIGLNAGEPVEQQGDLFGTAVQLAARICDLAGPGEICAAAVVKDLTAGSDLTWAAQQTATPKGFTEPVTIYTLSS